jgi:glycosyltransferase involved in cell wall biosynthesis
MRILFLSGWFPYPITNGSELRIYNLLRGLAAHHQVYMIAFLDSTKNTGIGLGELSKFCDKVDVLPTLEYHSSSLRSLAGLFSLTPRSLIDTFSPEMHKLIRDTVKNKQFSLVIASELTMANYWRAYQGIPAIFDDLEVGMLENRVQEASSNLIRLRHRLTPLKQRYYLRNLLKKFQFVTLVSSQELALAKDLVPGYKHFSVIPNCINLADYRGLNRNSQPGRLIFTGSFRYPANHQAMIWFLEEIYPLILQEVPQVELLITGDHANLPLPPSPNLTLTGFVEDIKPYIASAAVSIVPLRFGGGTRLKILEAFALGTPVVSTPKGAEGLDVIHNEHLLIANEPEAFAHAVVRLLKEPGLAQQMAENGRGLVAEKYDWEVVMPRFLEILERAAGQKVQV